MSQIPLREQLKALEHLQELDLKIDQLKKTKGGMPAALKALEDALAKAKAQVDTKKAASAEIEKNLRQSRAALEINNDRLGRSNARLEGVQNSNEFTAVNKEIEQLKKFATSLDEQIKKADQELQSVTKEIDALTEKQVKAQEERDAQAGALSAEGGKVDEQIGKLTAERAQFTVKVEVRTLAQYDRVRGARAGLGIAPAIAGRCKACNIMIPPQQFNELCKGTTLHSCPSCYRILFVSESQSK